jgi:hypothetical protein
MTIQPKLCRPRPPITIGTRTMKRYDVTVTEEPIPPAVEAAALAMCATLVPEPDGTLGAGWVVLHEGGDRRAMYVNAYTWVWDNVVEAHAAAAAQPHVGCPDDDSTHFVAVDRPWVGCMWERIPFGHERSAWARHVIEPEQPAVDAYLGDVLAAGWRV